MRLATKIELVLFTLLAFACFGCGAAERAKKNVNPVMLRNVACKKTSENATIVIADCACNAPVFAFNAKTGEQEIECAGETK
jgi:hypothetical protein